LLRRSWFTTSAAIPRVDVTLAPIKARFAMHEGHIVLLLGLFTRSEKDVPKDGCRGSDKCGGIRELHFDSFSTSC
jgi:hypothetical protein